MQLRVVTRTYQITYPRLYVGTTTLRFGNLRKVLEFHCLQPFEEVGSRIDIYRDGDLFVSVLDDLPDDEALWAKMFSPVQCAMIPLLCESINEGTKRLYDTYLDYLEVNQGSNGGQHKLTNRSIWSVKHPYLEHLINEVCAPAPTATTKR